jgi:hypothetical protein
MENKGTFFVILHKTHTLHLNFNYIFHYNPETKTWKPTAVDQDPQNIKITEDKDFYYLKIKDHFM